MRSRGQRIDESVRERAFVRKIAFFAREMVAGRLWPPSRAALRETSQRFRKEPATFDRLSRRAARQFAKVPAGDFVLQLFSMSSPVTPALLRPYAHYIDMTMAQVRRQWPPWAPFASDDLYEAWIARESATYGAAERVFTFSEAARRSVIEDYGVDPARVVAVGAAGHYTAAAGGKRSYGTRSIVFNGSDFERKSGDRVLAAFRLVRERFPVATLTVVAAPGLAPGPGVLIAGTLGRGQLFDLFDATDIVLAPTRLDSLAGSCSKR